MGGWHLFYFSCKCMLRLDICNVTLSRSTSFSAFIQMPLLWVQLQQVGQGLEFRTKSFQKMVVKLKQKKYCERRNIFSCFRDILKPMSGSLLKKILSGTLLMFPLLLLLLKIFNIRRHSFQTLLDNLDSLHRIFKENGFLLCWEIVVTAY